MNMTLKTHIEEAISMWMKLFSYDFDTYKSVVRETFINHRIVTKNQIDAFWKLLELSTGNSPISFYNDNDVWHFCQVSKPYEIYLDNEGNRWYYDSAVNRTLRVLPIEINEEVHTFLDSHSVSSKMKEILVRPLTVLRMCRQIFPEVNDVTKSNDWNSDFLSSIHDKASRLEKTGSIIQSALLCSEKDDHVQVVLSDICQEFFYHITKSLLNAEYLILDNYTALLDSVLNIKTLENDDDPTRIVLPCFVKSFILLIQFEKEMCMRINRIIREKGNYRIAIDYHADENVENRFSRSYFVYGETSRLYESFILSVIEMTTIDHLNKVNSYHIESLLLLWRRSDFVKKQSVNNKKFVDVVNMVRIKTASILSSMLKQPKDSQNGHRLYEFYLSMGEKHMEDILYELRECASKINYDNNEYISQRLDCRNKKISFAEIERKEELRWNDANKDLQAYDVWTKKGRYIYEKASSVIEEVCDGKDKISTIEDKEVQSILDIIEEYNNSSIQKTAPFYRKTIDFLDTVVSTQKFHNNIVISKRVLDLLSKILSESREYNAHSNNSQFPYYLPPFNTCYYKYENEKADCIEVSDEYIRKYDKEYFSDKFFYASLGSPLTNPYIFNRTIEKYYDKFLNQTLGYVYRLEEQTDSSFESIKNSTNSSITEQRNYIESISERLGNENLHTRNHTIQLVGMFAIFMAFITSVIGSIRVAKNVPEFIVFSLTFLAGVTLFSILIKDFGNKGSQSDKKMKKSEESDEGEKKADLNGNEQSKNNQNSYFGWWVLGIIVVLAIAVMLSYPIYQKSTDSQQETENVSQPSESNATNHIEIESNAIIVPMIDTAAKSHQ